VEQKKATPQEPHQGQRRVDRERGDRGRKRGSEETQKTTKKKKSQRPDYTKNGRLAGESHRGELKEKSFAPSKKQERKRNTAWLEWGVPMPFGIGTYNYERK